MGRVKVRVRIRVQVRGRDRVQVLGAFARGTKMIFTSTTFFLWFCHWFRLLFLIFGVSASTVAAAIGGWHRVFWLPIG